MAGHRIALGYAIFCAYTEITKLQKSIKSGEKERWYNQEMAAMTLL